MESCGLNSRTSVIINLVSDFRIIGSTGDQRDLREHGNRETRDIKEARERGEEKERQQREKLEHMEKNLEESEHEADTAETKLQLMESVLGKLKVGTEDLYIKCQCGNTPVLSLLGKKYTHGPKHRGNNISNNRNDISKSGHNVHILNF